MHEAMADLMYMMNTLVDKDGKILVEGIQDEVAPVTPGKYKCNVGYGFFRWGRIFLKCFLFLVLDISKIRHDSNFKSLRTAFLYWIF